MTLHQIAENWNGQVAKLCNWAINSLDSASDKDDVETTRTDRQRASVKPNGCTGRFSSPSTTEIRRTSNG